MPPGEPGGDADVARNRIEVQAPPERVFDVLLDADAYPRWVVGAKRIRGVDPDWPAEGSRFHHTVGAGPADVSDSSKILALDPPRRLVLEVRVRPVGVGRVTLDVEPSAEGTSTITMHEEPLAGPLEKLWGRPLDAVTHLRNAWSLRRLRALAEQRA